MSNTLLDDLKVQVRAGNVVAIVGAGISLASTAGNPLASWRGLLEHGINRSVELDRRLAGEWQQLMVDHLAAERVERWLEAAESLTQVLDGPTGGEYRRWLRDSVGSLQCTMPDLIRSLVKVASLLLTTNYDGILEQVTNIRGATWKDQGSLDRLLRGEEASIVHLHGYWDQPESVVLGVRSYDRLLRTAYAKNALRSLVTTRTLLFVGFGLGLEDPNFTALRQWVRRVFRKSEFRHYRLATYSEVEQLKNSQPLDERIFLLPYGDHYNDLPDFLDRLLSGVPVVRSAPVRKPSVSSTEDVTKPRVAISMGDATGIGPEIILRALRTLSEIRKLCIPVVVGSADILRLARQNLERRIAVPPIRVIAAPTDAQDNDRVIWVIDVLANAPIDLTHSAADPSVAQLSIECTTRAVGYAAEGAVAAVISAPVSKEGCLRLDAGIRGHTELIAQVSVYRLEATWPRASLQRRVHRG